MKIVVLAFLIILLSVPVIADTNKLRILDKAEKTTEIVSAKYQTVNRERAACIIFVTDLDVELDFRPNGQLVAAVVEAPGQWNVYVAPFERRIDIFAYGYEPLTVILREFGVQNLQSSDVYRLRLTGDKIGAPAADRDLFTVQFNVNLDDVYVSQNNGVPILNRGKVARFRVPAGTNSFTFIKDGYQDRMVRLEVSENVSQDITLTAGQTATTFKLPGFAVITSEPAGAELYLNDQLIGNTPYSGQLIAGSYTYSMTMPLYQTSTGLFTINEGETINLPSVKLTPRFGTVEITSNPAAAEVFINNRSRGKTPISSFRIDSGNYELEVRMADYHTTKEELKISEGDSKKLNFNLKPAFGELVVNSTPEEGAAVYIDDVKVGTTPYRNTKQPSGRYLIRVEKELWSASTGYVEVKDEQRTQENYVLTPTFGTVSVAGKGADIYVNNKLMGKDLYQGRLAQGRYTFTAKKDRHIDAERNVFLQTGQNEVVNLDPTPRMGAVTVSSQPFSSVGAEIIIDGSKRKETTPAVIPLLIGNYNVTVNHKDFLEQSRRISISEGRTEALEFTLSTYHGSVQAKHSFWMKNTLYSFGSTALIVAGILFFDSQGSKYIKQYNDADNPVDEIKAWENSEKALDSRDVFIYISILPAVYTTISFIQQNKYRKLKNEAK